jgi:hypothetical protein
VSKTPYYPWPQVIQPNRPLNLVRVRRIYKLRKSSLKHFDQEPSTAPYHVKSWGKPILKKLETDLQSTTLAFNFSEHADQILQGSVDNTTRHVNRTLERWHKDNTQKVYSRAKAQEPECSALYDQANRESTLRGAQAPYLNKENRRNRTNLQRRRYAQQTKEATAQIYARASARGRREGGGAHHGCEPGVGSCASAPPAAPPPPSPSAPPPPG